MAKPRIPNQKKQYRMLDRRLAAYMAAVRRIYAELNSEAAKIVTSSGYDGKKPFSWRDYPNTKARIRKLQERFVSQLGGLVMSGTSDEWKRSNLQQDLIVNRVLKAYHTSRDDGKNEKYYRNNEEALKAFQTRKEQGMNISDKLWDQSQAYREELQDVISVAIERGTDAVTLSKQISKYLRDFPSMQRDYKDKYGRASKVQNCEFRSIRLARSEINMAYRTAEQERWRQLDFVVGYEIKMSGAHPAHDVCDSLAGKYPKDFRWVGWHPNCMCFAIPILKTEEEFYADEDETIGDETAIEYADRTPQGEGLRGDELLALVHGADFDEYKGNAERGRTFQGYLAHLNGFAAPPTVLDPKAFEEYVTEHGSVVMYRGYRDHEAENIFNFMYGDAFDGKGGNGYGHYFSEHPWAAFSETGRYIEAVPGEDFRFVEFSQELQSEYHRELQAYRDSFSYSEYAKLSTDEERADFQLRSEAYSDIGAWATAKGYDGFVIHDPFGGDDEFVVFNRSKLIVKGDEQKDALIDEVERRASRKSVNEVTELPPQFRQWCIANRERIIKSEERGTLPYMLSDNASVITESLGVKVDHPDIDGFRQLMDVLRREDLTMVCTSHNGVPEFLDADGTYQNILSQKYKFDPRFFAMLDENKEVVLELHYANDMDVSMHSGNVIKIKIERDATDYDKIAVIYHEYGHEIDSQRRLYCSSEFEDIHSMLRERYAKPSQYRNGMMMTLGESIDYDLRVLRRQLMDMSEEEIVARYGSDYPTVVRMISKTRDLIASVDPHVIGGHSADYWAVRYNREKECIAHAFEAFFVGNPIAKQYCGDIYEELFAYIKNLV